MRLVTQGSQDKKAQVHCEGTCLLWRRLRAGGSVGRTRVEYFEAKDCPVCLSNYLESHNMNLCHTSFWFPFTINILKSRIILISYSGNDKFIYKRINVESEFSRRSALESVFAFVYVNNVSSRKKFGKIGVYRDLKRFMSVLRNISDLFRSHS